MSATSYASMHDDDKRIGLGPTLAGICFAVVIAWALVSVIELTGTLTSATQIRHRVNVINSKLRPIHHNLSFIADAGKIAALTVKINAAAAPLSGQAAQILTVAQSIQKKVPPILANATAINGVVHTINNNARSINSNVLAIGNSVQSIGGHVSSIGNSVASINSSVNSIGSRVNRINALVGSVGTNGGGITADLTRTNNDFAGILSTVHLIQPGLVSISGKVNTIFGTVQGIKSDFDGILANVGTANGTPTVVGHANSIDCSNIINLLGKTTDCNLQLKS
jgi:methyl-accepting chemotaxis protein